MKIDNKYINKYHKATLKKYMLLNKYGQEKGRCWLDSYLKGVIKEDLFEK